MTEKPGPAGNRLVVKHRKRTWSLDPQQHLLGAKPDFLLQCDQPLPRMAIFCDGWKYHASPAHNRIADDAQKRRDIRDGGDMVMAVTWEDLEPEVVPPTWFDPAVAGMLKANPQADLDKKTVELVHSSAIDQIVAWIDAPDPDQWQRLADWLPMFLVGTADQGKVPADADLGAVSVRVIDGEPLPGHGLGAWVWRQGSTVVLARASSTTDVEVAAVVDDRSHLLGPDHRPQWREWLRISNLLNLRSRPTTVTARSLVGTDAAIPSAGSVAVPAGWEQVFGHATETERRTLSLLADLGVPQPLVGHETVDGITVDIAWPSDQVALDLEMPTEDRHDLEAAGWTIVSDPSDIMAALEGES